MKYPNCGLENKEVIGVSCRLCGAILLPEVASEAQPPQAVTASATGYPDARADGETGAGSSSHYPDKADSAAWFKSGDVVENDGTAWLVWAENDQKHVLVYNLYGAVTVFPRAMLKKVHAADALPQGERACPDNSDYPPSH